MPSNLKKIRFQLTVNGVAKQLLSIVERSADQLVILWPLAHSAEFSSDERIQDQHVSVHGASTGKGTTIKSTTLTDDNTLLETVQFVPDIAGGWGTVVLGHACQDLSLDKYDLKSKKRDSIVPVTHHHTGTSTFVFALIVAEHPWPMEGLESFGNNLVFTRLKRFSVGCVYGFQNIPASPMSHTVVVATSEARWNKGPLSQLPTLPYSRSAREVAQLAVNCMDSSAAGNVERIVKWTQKNGADISEYLSFIPTQLTARPAIEAPSTRL